MLPIRLVAVAILASDRLKTASRRQAMASVA